MSPCVQQPLDLRAAEVRVEHEAGELAHQRAGARRRRARRSGPRCGGPATRSPVRSGSPVRAVPGEHGLALVGDADGGDGARRRAGDARRAAWPATASQISTASCSTQPGSGEVLGELAVATRSAARPPGNTARLRTPVVPASMAMTQLSVSVTTRSRRAQCQRFFLLSSRSLRRPGRRALRRRRLRAGPSAALSAWPRPPPRSAVRGGGCSARDCRSGCATSACAQPNLASTAPNARYTEHADDQAGERRRRLVGLVRRRRPRRRRR